VLGTSAETAAALACDVRRLLDTRHRSASPPPHAIFS
jgi:hypothetical protein